MRTDGPAWGQRLVPVLCWRCQLGAVCLVHLGYNRPRTPCRGWQGRVLLSPGGDHESCGHGCASLCAHSSGAECPAVGFSLFLGAWFFCGNGFKFVFLDFFCQVRLCWWHWLRIPISHPGEQMEKRLCTNRTVPQGKPSP